MYSIQYIIDFLITYNTLCYYVICTFVMRANTLKKLELETPQMRYRKCFGLANVLNPLT